MEKYYFTFLGNDPIHANHVQPIVANNYYDARRIMFDVYGEHWGFQYSEEQWNEWCNERPWYVLAETELPLITQEVLNDLSNNE